MQQWQQYNTHLQDFLVGVQLIHAVLVIPPDVEVRVAVDDTGRRAEVARHELQERRLACSRPEQGWAYACIICEEAVWAEPSVTERS